MNGRALLVGSNGGGTGLGDGRGGAPTETGPYPMGLLGLLATVTMLFAAFTAALLMRRAGSDWSPVRIPPLAAVGTLVLVGSSVALEVARGAVRSGRAGEALVGLTAARLLGVVFLVGQVAVWLELVEQGVFLATNPHAAFFYLLSAVHGAHVLGGLVALGVTGRRAARGRYTADAHGGLTHAAVYWHFVGAVWIYLYGLLLIF